jgi:hypothetical protein
MTALQEATMWHYSGDVNLEYGGVWVQVDRYDQRYGYANFVEVTDLDGACGATGMVLVEKGTVNFDLERIRKAVASCGWSEGIRKLKGAARKAAIIAAVKGYYGMDVDESETIQTFEDASWRYDGWKATKHVDPSDLKGYVESVYLD